MMKRLFLVVMAAMTLYSCGQQPQQQTEEPAVETRQISDLVSDPMVYENQTVKFEGMIGHICRHSGDKLRLVQTTDEAYSIEVMLGEMASQFSPEMEGQQMVLVGTLKTKVANLEDHTHEGEEECETTEQAIQMLKEKGVDPEITAYVELIRVEEK